MKTREALGVFSGREVGDTFLSDPRAVEKFSRVAQASRDRVLQRKVEADQGLSLPHVAALRQRIDGQLQAQLLDSRAPVIDKFSAYQEAKRVGSASGDAGLRALTTFMRKQWEKDPDGSYTVAQLANLRQQWASTYGGRTAAIDLLSERLPKVGYGTLPVRHLAQLAEQIVDQDSYNAVCRQAGLAGSRIDQVRARSFIRALLRHAEADPMEVEINQQQPDQLGGVDEGNAKEVLSGAPKITQDRACCKCGGSGLIPEKTAELGIVRCAACSGTGFERLALPTVEQVVGHVLNANTVKIAGYALFVNDADQVELRTPSGSARVAALANLEQIAADFLRTAAGAQFEPAVNTQQEPAVNISEAEGGDVLGKDSQTNDSATDAILPGEIKAQHPMSNQSGTSAPDPNLGPDHAGDDPSWTTPGRPPKPHSSDPHEQAGTSFANTSDATEPDHGRDEPGWANVALEPSSKKASISDADLLLGTDPASRYVQARAQRPSARLLEGIADESGWLARRAIAALDGESAPAAEPDKANVRVAALRRVRADLEQLGEGQRNRDASLSYHFAYDTQLGVPGRADLQCFIDGVECQRAYKVASVSKVAEGVVEALLEPIQSSPLKTGFEAKRAQIRIALGKDLGQDPAGMGGDLQDTLLNHEGEMQQPAEKDQIPRVASAPPGWKSTVEDMKEHKEIDNPFALSWWMHGKGYEPDKSDKEAEGHQRALSGIKPVPTLKSDDTSGKTAAKLSEGWGGEGAYNREIEADSAAELWEMHRGLHGEAPNFPQQAPGVSDVAPPVEPRPDGAGENRLPEPEPESV